MNLVAPPIKVWLIVISFGILFVFGFYTYSSSRFGIQYKTAIEIEKLIKNNISSNEDTLSVIIVGSSLTRNAFGDNFDISKTITENFGKPVKALKINISGLTIEKASDLSIFESIMNYPPDVLFFESRLLIESLNNKKKVPSHLIYSTIYWFNEFKQTIGYGSMNIENSILNNKSPKIYFTKKFDQAALNTILKKERRVRSYKENDCINKTFNLLNKQNKKVILLGFPNSKQVNKVFNKTELEFIKLVKDYQNQHNLVYWSIFNTPFSDSQFYDGSHLNYQGAKVYQNWFMKKIKTDL